MLRSVAMETLMGFTTAPGTTFTATTIGTNQSKTIRDSGKSAPKPLIISLAGSFQEAVPIIRIRAASFIENQIGIYTRAVLNQRDELLAHPWEVAAQDTLDWQQQGSTTAGNIDHTLLTVFYRHSPTIPAVALTAAEVRQYMVGEVCAENTITTGTDGQWGGGENFHAEQNPFQPDTWYVLLGNVQQVAAVGAIGYQASGFGNVRIAIPGSTNCRVTRRWFMDKSEATGLPTCLAFKSSSLGTSVIDAAVDENGADPIVDSYYAQLDASFDPDKLPPLF